MLIQVQLWKPSNTSWKLALMSATPEKKRPWVTSAVKFRRVTSLRNQKLTAAQIRAHIHVSQSSSSRHIWTWQEVPRVCKAVKMVANLKNMNYETHTWWYYWILYLSAQFMMDRKQCIVKLLVQPSRGLVDEKFIILVQKAPPGYQLTVHALHKCEDGHSWEAFGHYISNATGTVNGTQLKAQTWKIQ